jgi:excinuclease UvrABC nuclease subunit
LDNYNEGVLAHTLTFTPEQDETFFQELPAAAAVFLLRGEEGEPYVSKTANLRRRMQRLLGRPPENSKRLNLRDRVREVAFTQTGSEFESQILLYRLLRQSFPKTYAARLRLRPAPVVKLHLENEYPRASVTTRLGRTWHTCAQPPSADPGPHARTSDGLTEPSSSARPDSRGRLSPQVSNLYYGPFASRVAAERFASDALDFFKMRRCVDDLHPDPSFPGCVYSEMKMCLAPCFKGCTDAEYYAEVARVQAFFDTAGESLARELAEQRERASAETAFEEAAAIHTRIEKLKPVLAQVAEIVRRIDQLDAIIIQPSAEPGTVSLFRFRSAQILGPSLFRIERKYEVSESPNAHSQSAKPQSMESRVEEAIDSIYQQQSEPTAAHIEHLAILKRWYYRSHRAGEIFFADDRGSWPLRRIVRGIGRVYKGEESPIPGSLPVSETPSSQL